MYGLQERDETRNDEKKTPHVDNAAIHEMGPRCRIHHVRIMQVIIGLFYVGIQTRPPFARIGGEMKLDDG